MSRSFDLLHLLFFLYPFSQMEFLYFIEANESVVKRFIESTKTKTPHERGEALYQDKEIAQINIQIAHLGDGEV